MNRHLCPALQVQDFTIPAYFKTILHIRAHLGEYCLNKNTAFADPYENIESK